MAPFMAPEAFVAILVTRQEKRRKLRPSVGSFADQVREREVRRQFRQPTPRRRVEKHRLDPRRGELVESPTQAIAVGGELLVAVDHDDVEPPRGGGEQPAQVRSLPRIAEGLVGVRDDVAPVWAGGHLACEAADLAIQCVPAPAAGGLPGVDGDSPHDGSPLSLGLLR